MSATAKLAELGLSLPPVPTPLAAYVPAVRTGNLVYIAGQLPMADGKLLMAGKVGVEVSVEQARELAAQAALNALAAAASVGGGLDAITRIVQLTGYVACPPTFTEQPKVINGASELIGQILGAAGAHARVAIGVPVLPLDAPVEIVLVVEVAPA